MQPTDITAVNRPDLGAIAYEYMLEADQRGFIALLLLPIFEVMQQSAQYPIIPLESLLKLEETSRAARGKYNRSDYKFDFGNYSCKENGWEEVVDDREAALYARYFDAEEVATKRAIDIILRGQEARVAAKVFNLLAENNIPVSIVTTSEIKISYVIYSISIIYDMVYHIRLKLKIGYLQCCLTKKKKYYLTNSLIYV